MVMPYRLKNVRTTYQRIVTRMFRDKIERTVEVYIDDVVIKRKKEERHVADLNEKFEILKRHKLHLNANKFAFSIGVGKLLGYMITNWGIEVN